MRGACTLALAAAVCMPLLSTPLFRVPLEQQGRIPVLSAPRPSRRTPAPSTPHAARRTPVATVPHPKGHIVLLNPPRPVSRLPSVLKSPRPMRRLPILNPPRTTHPAPLRVYRGVDDNIGKYKYVVTLLGKKRMRTCTGTLIAPTWVLTAAHCDIGVDIQYGDMTVPRANISTTRKIQKVIPHPSYRDFSYFTAGYIYNDIAMILVQEVPLTTFGVLSGVDYRTLIGYEVEYAGLGITGFRSNKTLDFMKPVGIGFGMIRSCKDLKSHNFPEMCVAHKCTWRQSAMRGDSGGPLFLDGKVIGVNAALYFKPLTTICTPVSPYISWIQEVMRIEGKRYIGRKES